MIPGVAWNGGEPLDVDVRHACPARNSETRRDNPMEVPEAGMPGSFIQQTHDGVVGVAGTQVMLSPVSGRSGRWKASRKRWSPGYLHCPRGFSPQNAESAENRFWLCELCELCGEGFLAAFRRLSQPRRHVELRRSASATREHSARGHSAPGEGGRLVAHRTGVLRPRLERSARPEGSGRSPRRDLLGWDHSSRGGG